MKIKKNYTWPSPAKINLCLYVTGVRKNQYHDIQTLFQFLNYSDELKIIPNRKGCIELFAKKQYLFKKKIVLSLLLNY